MHAQHTPPPPGCMNTRMKKKFIMGREEWKIIKTKANKRNVTCAFFISYFIIFDASFNVKIIIICQEISYFHNKAFINLKIDKL
jgi:hypothetical protein